MIIDKKECSELVQAIVGEIRKDLKEHGTPTDSCTLHAGWRAFENLGIVELKNDGLDFDLNPECDERNYTISQSERI